jgi:hypothetical protein
MLIVILDFAQPVDAVVWVRNVVLVNLGVTARCANDEIDKLSNGLGLVLVESA